MHHQGNPKAAMDQIPFWTPPLLQNEINEEDAKQLVAHGCGYVIEGANMPSTADAVHLYSKSGIVYASGKAANAGAGFKRASSACKARICR